MPRVIVIDDEGNERMNRDSNAPMLPPPPGWDEARWAGTLVESCLRRLADEDKKPDWIYGQLSS